MNYEKEVKKVYHTAEYMGMGFGGKLHIHSIYKDDTGINNKNLLGQSMTNKKDAWKSAYENMTKETK